jgi:hypothetical protein
VTVIRPASWVEALGEVEDRRLPEPDGPTISDASAGLGERDVPDAVVGAG